MRGGPQRSRASSVSLWQVADGGGRTERDFGGRVSHDRGLWGATSRTTTTTTTGRMGAVLGLGMRLDK